MGKFSASIEKVVERMNYHSAHPSRILGEFKWVPYPVSEGEGQKDFPVVRLWVPQVQEDFRASRHCVAILRFGLHIATERKLGMVAHLQALERVMDAVETDTDTAGTIDPGLNGTLLKPFMMTVGNVFALDLSVNSEITLTLDLKPYERGRRRTTT